MKLQGSRLLSAFVVGSAAVLGMLAMTIGGLAQQAAAGRATAAQAPGGRGGRGGRRRRCSRVVDTNKDGRSHATNSRCSFDKLVHAVGRQPAGSVTRTSTAGLNARSQPAPRCGRTRRGRRRIRRRIPRMSRR